MLQPNLDITQPTETRTPPSGLLFWLARLLAPRRSGNIKAKPRFARRAVAGQSLVELALSLPFLITLLLALLEIGFLIRSHLTVLYATREGARAEAAAGNTVPMNWPIQDNSARYYEQADGDTVMVNNVNAALQEEKSNALFLSTYKADSTFGDPCQHTGGSGWAHTVVSGTITTCVPNSGLTTNYAKWPVYTTGNISNSIYFQEVFQRLPASNGFSRQVMDGNVSGYAGVQICPSVPPYSSSCGSNVNNLPGNWNNNAPAVALGAPNPWYPGYRCGVDPNAPSLDPGKVGSPDYYNQSPRGLNSPALTYPVTRDWVGVRIDYKHPWITPWFKIPTSSYPDGIILSDKSVFNLEPRPYITGQNILCNNSPPV